VVEEIIMLMVDPRDMVEVVVVEVKHFSGDHGITLHHLGDLVQVVVEELFD
jgi:hypothetical protein